MSNLYPVIIFQIKKNFTSQDLSHCHSWYKTRTFSQSLKFNVILSLGATRRGTLFLMTFESYKKYNLFYSRARKPC